MGQRPFLGFLPVSFDPACFAASSSSSEFLMAMSRLKSGQ